MRIRDLSRVTLVVIKKDVGLINNLGALTAEVDAAINPDVFTMPYGVVMRQRAELGLPPIESTGRCKRKIVNDHPEFKIDADVEAKRELLAEEFKEYARACE